MYLKGVEIYGFKSFGERVKIDFDGGITAIVGPNGSGKSNILDSILWVLGEQSYKNIRAKDSKDIIFSGGEAGKAATHAEVSLYIDNKDKFFQIEADNIKITRKLYNTGENDYLINDKKVRLKDVGELFLDTGVGKSAYSVIGQGKVERIISSSSKEIKGIIEEAAGVKKHQLKKVEAEKRLEKVEIELEKIEYILNEMGENKNKVEKQSKRALEYLEIKKERDSLEKTIAKYDYDLNKKILLSTEEENQKIESIISNLIEEKNKSDLEEKENEQEKKRVFEEIEKIGSNNKELKEKIEILEKEKIKNEERKKSLKREIEEKNKRILEVESDIEERKNNRLKSKEESEELKGKLDKLKDENREYDEELKRLEGEKKECELENDLKKKKVMDLEVEKLKLFNEIETSEKRIKGSEYKIEQLKIGKEEQERKILENQDILKDKIDEKEKKSTRLSKVTDEQRELEEKITAVSREINEVSEFIRKNDFEEQRIKAKLQGLYRVQENNEGFYKGVKEILNLKMEGVVGAVISLIQVDEQYQKAIEAGIPGNLQDIVVENSEVAKKCIDMLKRNKWGKASFLALDTIKIPTLKDIPKEEGVIGRGSELITIDSRYQKVLEFLLGNLLVVENIDIGLKILSKNKFLGNIVTISGELLSSRGRITGGENSNSLVTQLFERKKEIKDLEKKRDLLEKELKIKYNRNRELNQELEKVENQVVKLDGEQDILKKELKDISRECDDVERAIQKVEREKNISDIEIKEEENYISEYKKKLDNSHGDKETTEKLLVDLKKNLTLDSEKISKLIDKIEIIKNKYADKKLLFMNMKDKYNSLKELHLKEKDELNKAENKKMELDSSITMLEKQLEELNGRFVTIEDEIVSRNKELNSDDQQLIELKNRYQNLEIILKENGKKIRKLDEEYYIKKGELEKRKDEIDRVRLLISELENKLVELDDVVELEIDGKDIDELRKKGIKLGYKLNSFENINLDSIEEYKKIKERYDFIELQQKDLKDGKDGLNKLILEIQNTIEENFYEAYENINKNFNNMCRETLVNSEGKLILNSKDDFEQCGVEISVKYQNKKAQSLSLLSGGEKSMVAIAFIMSIFMYKPSPFTFLDEIEAALDEKNTRNLIAKLKEFTDKSQFILITHNKETMKSADTLYGVTMNKKIGISKLVPVKI